MKSCSDCAVRLDICISCGGTLKELAKTLTEEQLMSKLDELMKEAGKDPRFVSKMVSKVNSWIPSLPPSSAAP